MLIQAYEERDVEGSLAALEGKIAAARDQGEAPPANTLAEYAQLRADKSSHERGLSEWASPSDSVAALGYSIPRAALFAGGWLLILGLSMFRNGAVSVLRRYWGELQKLERAGNDAAIRALFLLRTEFDEIGWLPRRGRLIAPRERWIRTFMKPTDWASLFVAYAAVASTAWALITAWRAGLQPDLLAAVMIGVPGLLGLLFYRISLGRYARFKQLRSSRRRPAIRLSEARVG